MFDMLSDIGGLSGIFVSAFAIMASSWNYLAYDNYLVTRLFTVRAKESTGPADPEAHGEAETATLKTRGLPECKELFLAVCPCSKKFGCKRSRQEAAMLAARDKLESEIDLVSIIKSIRYTALALKALLPRKKRLELKYKADFFEVNPD